MPGKSIMVIGSSNTDMVIKSEKLPLPGQTIIGGKFFLFQGGKGANQAVAASRLGGEVTLIAKLGRDIFGTETLKQLKKENINTDFIISDPDNPSGVALINVDSKGENSIVVAQGANGALTVEDILKTEKEFSKNDILLMQLEIPVDTVVKCAELAMKYSKKVILNPAPAVALPATLLRDLYLITPNESEAAALTGMKTNDLNAVKSAARKIKEKGVLNVIITLGPEGAYIFDESGGRLVPSIKVKAIDSTAAGDVFNGALAVALSEGAALDEAVEFSNRAAAISVTRMGAQASAPYRNETMI